MLYGSKYLRSSTFAVISRTKIYITLILFSLFEQERVNIKLLIISVISFIGITLVVDSTVFGLGEVPDEVFMDTEEEIQHFQNQILSLLACFVYVIVNSLCKFLETVYSI